jgi:diguanylate cyclase (GGDEF)-like protein
VIESTREKDAETTVVLVHPLGLQLGRAASSTAIEVASVLDAIAMVARSTSRRGINAVVAEHSEFTRFPDAATAIKRLNDRVRVIRIIPDECPPADPAVPDIDASIPFAEAATRLAAAIAGRFHAAPAHAGRTMASDHPGPESPAAGLGPAEPESPHHRPEGSMPGPDSDPDPSDALREAPAIAGVSDELERGGFTVERRPADAVGEAERRALSGVLLPDLPPGDPPVTSFVDRASGGGDLAGSLPGDGSDHGPAVDPPTPRSPGAPDRPGPPDDAPRESPDPFSGFLPEAEHPLSFAEAVRARESQYDAGSTGSGRTEEPLGDVDLVEAVLAGEGRIGTVAVRLIREQTGWRDLEFHVHRPERTGQAPMPACAEVADGGRRFGVLCSGIAGEDELALWAGWLSRWLELGRRHELYRVQSLTDDLTGACNRRSMFEFLGETLAEARARRRPVTVMVFDIDDFKQFNDAHGHAAGDVILRETITLLRSVTRRSDRVCRIGGDEFAVIFADIEGPRVEGSSMPDDVEVIARRFQSEVVGMRFPRLGLDAPGTLSISAGLATYPWDGADAETLLRVADERALESKRRGKNHITFGPGVPFSGDAGPRTDGDREASPSSDTPDDAADH